MTVNIWCWSGVYIYICTVMTYPVFPSSHTPCCPQIPYVNMIWISLNMTPPVLRPPLFHQLHPLILFCFEIHWVMYLPYPLFPQSWKEKNEHTKQYLASLVADSKFIYNLRGFKVSSMFWKLCLLECKNQNQKKKKECC